MEQSLKKGVWSDQALKILQERYLHRHNGVQETPEEMLWRVASEIAKADQDFGKNREEIDEIAKEFYNVMVELKFLPNSPTFNAGLNTGLQYSACYVLPIEDSISEIFETVKNSAIIHQSGGGTGFSFSHLRPNSYLVNRSNGVASGPVSFMKVFDGATEAIKQGGKRRGANMGILRVDHPDIEEFISCKLNGSITNFNISVAITDAFMKAFFDATNYDLLAYAGWPSPDGGRYEGGEIVGQKNAREIFAKIVDAAWKTGDPGLVFIDQINNSPANPIPGISLIEATNPCGEQPLPPYESCNLGSINLVKFINKKEESFNWDKLEQTVRTAVHFLDNVISVNPYPLPIIDKAVKDNRRIGLGIMGWADVLFELGIPYNSQKALDLAEEVMSFIKVKSHSASINLAFIRGSFSTQDNSIYRNGPGQRNSTVTTIAPTGTISIIAGASSGIEPIFALAYQHVVKRHDGERILSFVNPIFDKVIAERNIVWSEDLQNELLKTGTIQHMERIPEDIRKVFVTAHEIDPEWHVRMQSIFQRHTDNGVSKTVNLPNNATVKDVEQVYLLAYSLNCLGVTVFRDGCKDIQVLNVGVSDKKEEKPTVKVELPTSVNSVKIRPNNVRGTTYRKLTPVGTAFITVNDINAHGEPFEVFINVGKAGSDVSADAEGLGRLISLILRSQNRSPRDSANDIIGQLRGIGSGRSQGFGKNRIMSLSDAVAQVLIEHLNLETTDELFLSGVHENKTYIVPRIGDLCPGCGQATLVMQEGCKKCPGCGHSEC